MDDRVDRHIADFAEQPEQVPAADIVILHRVICCYPDADTLTSAACGRAKDRVAITIPREAPWVKLGFWAMNAWLRIRRIAFRGYSTHTRRSSTPRRHTASMPPTAIAACSGTASSSSASQYRRKASRSRPSPPAQLVLVGVVDLAGLGGGDDAPRVPGDLEDHEGDGEADQWVGRWSRSRRGRRLRRRRARRSRRRGRGFHRRSALGCAGADRRGAEPGLRSRCRRSRSPRLRLAPTGGSAVGVEQRWIVS